jgi:hypothetical protein
MLKDTVDPHVESLRRGRSFCEGITDIGTVDALVLEGATNLATTSRTVTDATGLLVWASSVLTLYVHTQLKTEASGGAGIGSANIPC